MENKLKLSVIIVNYNSGNYALDCIHSLQKQQGIDFEIIVVDNASQDNRVSLLKEQLGNHIQLIESPENLGFGRANNLAASQAGGEYLLLLNPDTVISDQHALKTLVSALEASPQAGLLGPAIEEPRKNKRVLPRYRYPSSSHLKYTTKFNQLPGKIAWLLGACLLIKCSFYHEIGGFDPDYFLYGEDADIGLKVRLAGYEVAYCEAVKITHVAGVSEAGSNTLDKWLRKKRGLFLFCTKHFDKRDAIHLANMSVIKSYIYLSFLLLGNMLKNKDDLVYQDRRSRLLATITAAREMKQNLLSSASS